MNNNQDPQFIFQNIHSNFFWSIKPTHHDIRYNIRFYNKNCEKKIKKNITRSLAVVQFYVEVI